MMVEAPMKNVPKVELHAHLNGCIPPNLLRELAAERSVSLSAKHFVGAAAVADDGMTPTTTTTPTTSIIAPVRSLADCFDLFAELPNVINDLPALRRITQAALEFFADHHVVYLELRSTPKRLWKDFRHQPQQCHARSGDNENEQESLDNNKAMKLDYVKTILDTISAFNHKEEERYRDAVEEEEQQKKTSPNAAITSTTTTTMIRLPLVCRFIVSIDRATSLQDAAENVAVAVSLQSTGLVVGLDLGGNPTCQSFKMFEPILAQARDCHGLKCTIHCAEVESDEYQDILAFRPNRLGHAVLMPREAFVGLNIPVECCPTSNLLTLELHHQPVTLQTMNVQQWIADDYPFVICTDDPGIFHTSPTQELQLIQDAFGPALDVERVMLRSIHYGFAETDLLERIGERMQHWFAATKITPC
jgi:adenosine deaminase